MTKEIQERLEYLRGEIKAERISYGEIAELQALAQHIKPDDILLLEWAGVPEAVNVSFRMFPEGEVIAFISGYPCNPGMIMSYQHIGQHSEACVELQDELKPCTSDEYADLLTELQSIGYAVTMVEKV